MKLGILVRGKVVPEERGMPELNEFIESSEVQDLPLLGRKNTWCNSREGVKWSRIDRVLVDPRWLGFSIKIMGIT